MKENWFDQHVSNLCSSQGVKMPAANAMTTRYYIAEGENSLTSYPLTSKFIWVYRLMHPT